MLLVTLITRQPTRAAVSELTLHRRSCAGVTAYVLFDGFAVGKAPYYIAFAADLNGNGIYGEADEALVYVRARIRGQAFKLGGRLNFPTALRDGDQVSVMAYEIDNAGVVRTSAVGPVTYTCSSRVALDPTTESGSGNVQSAVIVVIDVEATQVYAAADPSSKVLGGVGKGQRVNVLAIHPRGDWAKIAFGGGSGWILWRTNGRLLGPRDAVPVSSE
jgi:hypothetical protein